MPSSLFDAIRNRDVEAVRGLLDVKWDRVKRRRIEEAKDDGKGPLRHAMLRCIHPDFIASEPSDVDKSFEILELMVQNGFDSGYIDKLCTTAIKRFSYREVDMGEDLEPRPGPMKAAIVLGALMGDLEPSSPYCVRVCKIFIDNGIQLKEHSAEYVADGIQFYNHIDCLKEFVKAPNALAVDDVLTPYFVWHVAASSRVECLKILFEARTAPISWMDVVPYILSNLMERSDTKMLRLLIEHGLPPIPHESLVDSINSIASIEFLMVIIEHVDHKSPQWNGRSITDWVHDNIHAIHGRADVLQLLRQLPVTKLRSWAEKIRPSNELTTSDDICSVCYDDYTGGEEIVKLPCGHVFHLECMVSVAESKRDFCPYCRQRYI